SAYDVAELDSATLLMMNHGSPGELSCGSRGQTTSDSAEQRRSSSNYSGSWSLPATPPMPTSS
ncbi:unnamed protein product, partial [Amoebophrya sp. A25]